MTRTPPLERSRSETTLRTALFANAGFSTVTATTLLLASDSVAGFTGIPGAELRMVGVDLGLFALGLFALLTRDLTRTWVRAVVLAVIALDVLWVIGSAALLLAPNSLTVAGQWTVGVVACVVADFALFQGLGWRGMGRELAERREPAGPSPAATTEAA
ncbi:MAG: hypothetical protein MI919_30215 [Holophagales bacterium]|nr:hypothetical protein [Holophagales bacterium]